MTTTINNKHPQDARDLVIVVRSPGAALLSPGFLFMVISF